MSPNPLFRSTLDSIYDQVLENLKISGQYDLMRVSLVEPSWSDSDFQTIINDFVEKCKKFCSQMDLRKNRKDLRASLDENFPEDYSPNIMLKKCIEKILEVRKSELKAQFTKHAEDYLKKEFQQELSPHIDHQTDQQEPSPHIDHQTDQQEPSPHIDHQDDHQDSSLTNDDHQEVDMEIEIDAPSFSPISVFDENLLDDLNCGLSPVSSVSTNEISDYEEDIVLDEDEADLVGQPKNSRINIGELQGTIEDLQTKANKTEAEEPQGNATTGRRATRQRKSNPRYSNEHFTS